ncbi:hypothetical protein [Afipia broomeae]|uniref:Uncharacterized protein n=1 Tax=Afipia broomeae ATCC 49717 TaxID=883078 RepID=K8NZ54_9BRAD|nr:hypothetical protein [Afipia broomeae]EKS34486.1 hypothetical protein HMPREF9695_04396 [Afipia broomeae ATCC 49717]
MFAIVVCVWHPETDELLFEGASASLSIRAVQEVVGPSFPENPELMAAYPVPVGPGRALLRMMGKKFDGEGEFQVSREPLKAAVVSDRRH